jgi:exopolysaccharide production protein ExoZ
MPRWPFLPTAGFGENSRLISDPVLGLVLHMISNLQVLRGVAALAVVFYHSGYAINGVLTEFRGVAIFFVISGFIMTHITRENSDQFLIKRLVRIVPLYWLCTLAFLLWGYLGFANPPYTYPLWAHLIVSNPTGLLRWFVDNAYQLVDSTLLWKLAKSLLFVPYLDVNGDPHPLLGVGWTLNLEMFYYFLFAIALWINQRLAPFFVTAMLFALITFGPIPSCAVTACSFWGHDYGTFFVLGIGCYYAWLVIPGSPRSMAGALAILLLPAFIVWNLIPGLFQWVPKIDYAMPTIVVFMALWLHKAKIRCDYKFALLLGAASYSLYLTHLIVVDTARTTGRQITVLNPSQNVVAMGGVLLLSITLAIVVHKKIEAPIIAALHRRIRPFARLEPAIMGSQNPVN